MKTLDFKPKLISALKNYNRETLMADVMAGVIVGIVALPLAIAFGIASGVSPEKGIITAIVAGLIISATGGSKVQIGGPTGAFIVIVAGIIGQYGMTGLTIATLMAGIFLIGFGLLRLGTIIKYIPYPIIVGFTSGIAVTIFTTQIKDLMGMQISNVPADFIEKWIVYLQNLQSIDLEHLHRSDQRGDYRCDAQSEQTHTWFARCHHPHDGGRPAVKAICWRDNHRDHRRPFQHQLAAARSHRARADMGHDQGAGSSGIDHRRTGCYRESAIGNGCRWCDWRPPQFEHRADRSGTGQHRFALVWRNTCYRSHRTNHDQHQ